MPAFGAVLSRPQIVATLSFSRNSWSFDYRAWQERANAAAGSAADQPGAADTTQ